MSVVDDIVRGAFFSDTDRHALINALFFSFPIAPIHHSIT